MNGTIPDGLMETTRRRSLGNAMDDSIVDNHHHHHHSMTSSGVVVAVEDSMQVNNGHNHDCHDVSKATTTKDIYIDDSLPLHHELRLVWELALPSVLIQLATTVPAFIASSYIGRHFGSIYLAGYMLANLTGNLCTLTLLQGIFSALDTLCPQAFGAKNYPEVGLIAIRGMLLSLLIVIPVVTVLFLFMKPILLLVGEDDAASSEATAFYRIFSLSLPFYALQQVVWKFLSAQNVTLPPLIVSMLSSFVLLPIFLYTLGNRYGFLGTAVAVFLYQLVQSILLLSYLSIVQPYDARTWPMLDWHTAVRRTFRWKQLSIFISLGAGGMLMSSEWIYWEVLSLMIGTLGVVDLSVHTIPTQVITVTFMIPLGIGTAMAVRIGTVLPMSSEKAKHLCWYGSMATTVFFAILSSVIYFVRHFLYSVFTSEAEVIAGCEEIWSKVALYCFVLSIFGVNMGIAVALGRQWLLGMLAIVFLWVIGLPAAYYVAVVRGGGLNGAWQTIWPPYVAINFILMSLFANTDWEGVAEKIRIREGVYSARNGTEEQEERAVLTKSTTTSTTTTYGSV